MTQVFKSGLSKFLGRQPLKNLKGYGPLNLLCPIWCCEIVGRTARS